MIQILSKEQFVPWSLNSEDFQITKQKPILYLSFPTPSVQSYWVAQPGLE